MTTRTLFTTWTRLTGETLGADEQATSEVERLLEPYEAWLLGNGDIVGPVESRDEFMENIEDIREQIRMMGVI